jgi:hypothetical protein
VCGKPVLPPGNITDMGKILARITLLLVGADACTPRIINKVWGADNAVQLVLGGPRGNLSLVRCRILTHQKVAINTFYIWLTNPLTPVLPPDLAAFKFLPRTIHQLLLNAKDRQVFACEPVPSGMQSSHRLTENLRNYIVPDTLSIEEKAIQWFGKLLLRRNTVCWSNALSAFVLINTPFQSI